MGRGSAYQTPIIVLPGQGWLGVEGQACLQRFIELLRQRGEGLVLAASLSDLGPKGHSLRGLPTLLDRAKHLEALPNRASAGLDSWLAQGVMPLASLQPNGVDALVVGSPVEEQEALALDALLTYALPRCCSAPYDWVVWVNPPAVLPVRWLSDSWVSLALLTDDWSELPLTLWLADQGSAVLAVSDELFEAPSNDRWQWLGQLSSVQLNDGLAPLLRRWSCPFAVL